jgi:surfeit locus 1 family protein
MLRFLARPRWIVFSLLVVVMTVGFVRLGFWQLDRLHGRRYYNHLYEQGMAAAPVAAEPLVDRSAGMSLFYRHVTATGRYDPSREVILYGRSNGEQPGSHVLTPLRLPDGRALLVDRGWVPFGMDTAPVAAALPPAGTVTLNGLLAPSEPGGSPQTGATRTFTKVDLAQIGRQLPYRLLPYFLMLQIQSPPQPGTLPVVPPAPALDDGPHLSYALQWFAFAMIAFVGFWILVVRGALAAGSDEDADAERAIEPRVET